MTSPVAYAVGEFVCNSVSVKTSLAVFRPSTNTFFVDMNNSRNWNAGDAALPAQIPAGYVAKRPVVRQFEMPSNGACRSQLGLFLEGPGGSNDVRWLLDGQADGIVDGIIHANDEWIGARGFGLKGDAPYPLLFGDDKTSGA